MVRQQPIQFAKSCSDCPIRHRAVCANCEADELTILEGLKFYKTFAAGEPVIWAGDYMHHVGSVVTGVAAISQTMEDGRRQMVGLLFPSDFVGRPGRAAAAFDITAATEVVLCRFERKPFEQLLINSPTIGRRLLQMTLNELDAAREWMLLLGRKTAREKISSLLAIIARREVLLGQGRVPSPMAFDLHITREAMADYLGLTIETVSRQLAALRNDGVIGMEGKRRILIPDLPRLLDEAGHDADGGLVD